MYSPLSVKSPMTRHPHVIARVNLSPEREENEEEEEEKKIRRRRRMNERGTCDKSIAAPIHPRLWASVSLMSSRTFSYVKRVEVYNHHGWEQGHRHTRLWVKERYIHVFSIRWNMVKLRGASATCCRSTTDRAWYWIKNLVIKDMLLLAG